MHEIKCAKLNGYTPFTLTTEPAQPIPAVKQDEPVSKEPESALKVILEAKEVKPVTKKEPVKPAIKAEVKPVARKSEELFNQKPEPKQEAKPATESKKAEKETKERGLFSFYREDEK